MVEIENATEIRSEKECVASVPLSLGSKIMEMKAQIDIKKTGYNKHKHYYYYKPEDVNNAAVAVCRKFKVLNSFNMTYNTEKQMYECVVSLKDLESNDVEISKYDTPLASIPGSDGAQCAGGTLTYGKRYSYMNVFDIAEEADDLDSDLSGSREAPKTAKTPPPTTPKTTYSKAQEQPTPKADNKIRSASESTPPSKTPTPPSSTVRSISAPQRKFMGTLVEEGKLVITGGELENLNLGIKEASEIITKAKEASAENPHVVNFDDLPF